MTTHQARDAAALATRTDFVWHQRFELAPGVQAPGVNDVDWLLRVAGIPEDLTGATVLDIGTTNGGAAFTLERRGAARVLATDIVPPSHFGFTALRDALRSRVEFRQVSVYELTHALRERFDIVLFWGVLYHLRHPLLGLDNVHAVTGGTAYIESAVCDHETKAFVNAPIARFYRRDELGGDGSNWFAPSLRTLVDWCESSGLPVKYLRGWPQAAPQRAMVVAVSLTGPPEYQRISYERPLSSTVSQLGP